MYKLIRSGRKYTRSLQTSCRQLDGTDHKQLIPQRRAYKHSFKLILLYFILRKSA